MLPLRKTEMFYWSMGAQSKNGERTSEKMRKKDFIEVSSEQLKVIVLGSAGMF